MKENVEKRSRLGTVASLVGIAVNVVLAVGKILVGAIFGVVSVVADGLNNLTDCGSSALSMLSFKLSAKPADKEHPYGHERIEYVFSLIVAFLILFVALETVRESIGRIAEPTVTAFSFWTVGVLVASILAKCGLFLMNSRVGKRIDSDVLRATAMDSLSDCVSTGVVLICLLISRFSGVSVDGYAGVLVALFIAWSGIGVLKETFSKLIGQAPSQELLTAIKQRVLAHDAVLGVHDLNVYSYGPNKYFASVHIEVDARVDVMISHELVDAIEREFILETNVVLTGHLDPIVTDDENVNALRAEMERFVKEIDERFSLHDFRMVVGEKRTNVLFDVAIPFDAGKSKAEIQNTVESHLTSLDQKYCPIVTVEYNL